MDKDYFSNLTEEEIDILKNKGTEPPFSGEYNDFYDAGIFVCRACQTPLYESNTKFNSGCGWPSFDDEIEGSIVRYEDLSLGRKRTEICCAKCDGHLGHVFVGEKTTIKDTRHCVNSLSIQFKAYKNLDKATFGAGCFWSVEQVFKSEKGVYLCHVGYMGGETINPTYEDVCNGYTNHAEVVEIYFDSKVISYNSLLEIFWSNHNPTTLNQQGLDIGTQYRSIIFYHCKEQQEIAQESILEQTPNFQNPIVTQLKEVSKFYRAEEYHQDYLNKNSNKGCSI